jgi:hypothetical protein
MLEFDFDEVAAGQNVAVLQRLAAVRLHLCVKTDR